MSNIVKLATTEVDKDRRQATRDVLRKYLDDDDLESVFIVARRANGEWLWNFEGNVFTTDMVGRIEISKQEMIRGYLDSLKE